MRKFFARRLAKISDICSDIAGVSLASIVVPFFLDKQDLMLVLFGLVAAIVFWSMSLVAARE